MPNNFAIFIMVYGRPDKMKTDQTLRKVGYTGEIYYVGDNTDETIPQQRKRYGDKLLVFDKQEAALLCDSGDNSGDLRSTLYSANTIPKLAKELGLKHYMIMCDDYIEIRHFLDERGNFLSAGKVWVSDLDKIIEAMIRFLDETKSRTIALSQGGDFIGGVDSPYARPMMKRKAMNSFLCSVDNPIKFMGRLNEDVTTYVRDGHLGALYFTIMDVALNQKDTQSQSGGLTDVYLDAGTYTKSFFSVMYNPSCIKVAMMGEKNRRIHHRISWRSAVPQIVHESQRKLE